MLPAIRSAEASLVATIQATTQQLDAVGTSLPDAVRDLARAAGEARQRLQDAADAVRGVLLSLSADLSAIVADLALDITADISAPAAVMEAVPTFDAPAPPPTPANVAAMEQIREELANLASAEETVSVAACSAVEDDTDTHKPVAPARRGTTRVISVRDLDAGNLPDHFVYVGRKMPRHKLACIRRGSPFGNPKELNGDLDAYREYVLGRPDLVAVLPTLKGCVLGCWCVNDPDPMSHDECRCHAQVLARLVEQA